jgi:hypothetical protein
MKGGDPMIAFKSILRIFWTSLVLFVWVFPALGSEISDGFSERFNSLVPPKSSSVHSDYLFEQISLGSAYTVRVLDMIHTQNRELNEKYDLLLERNDTMIRQNKEMIELLKKIEKAGHPQL